MERRVFISHPIKDRAAANTICEGLEGLGIRCWIAPRDIQTGAIWAKALMDGVDECSEMVLVFSEHANSSEPVIAEVDAASKRKRRIIPVRIREVSPKGALEFYIGWAHWFDAFPAPAETHVQRLALEITGLANKPAAPPVVASAPRTTEREKNVQIFFHRSDVAETSTLAAQIANQLEAEGWSVTRGYTELEIHSRGVWIHGSTDEQRQIARRLVGGGQQGGGRHAAAHHQPAAGASGATHQRHEGLSVRAAAAKTC